MDGVPSVACCPKNRGRRATVHTSLGCESERTASPARTPTLVDAVLVLLGDDRVAGRLGLRRKVLGEVRPCLVERLAGGQVLADGRRPLATGVVQQVAVVTGHAVDRRSEGGQ